MNARESTFLLLALLLVPQAVQADARSHCAQAIEHLGFETSDYVFEQGGFFSFDTHRFGTVACEVDSEGQIRQIARGRQLLAEGDYIGPEVLEQRDRILALARQERDGAMEERTVAIDAAREAYRSQIEQIDLAERATLSELVARSSPFSEDKETIVDSEPPSQGQTSEAPADDPIDPAPVPQGDRAGTIAPEKSEEGAAGVGTETIDPPQETERDASTETENATSGKPIRMYVVADRLTRRTCPSTACGKVG